MSLGRPWKDLLFLIYKDCRDLPHWGDLYEFYDDEDRGYFMQLDEFYGK